MTRRRTRSPARGPGNGAAGRRGDGISIFRRGATARVCGVVERYDRAKRAFLSKLSAAAARALPLHLSPILPVPPRHCSAIPFPVFSCARSHLCMLTNRFHHPSTELPIESYFQHKGHAQQKASRRWMNM